MPSLFVMPKPFALTATGTVAPGAKLTFTATGTATPQNTYQDILLTTPHANPVIADSAGFFAVVYLDPSLPNYRVKLSTSADVQIWQLDDIPSNQNTAQQFRLKATAPSLTFEETDASANNKIWRLKVNAEQMLLTILNDAEGVETTVFTFDRTGTTVDSLNFAGQYLKVNGLNTATQDGGSIVATLTGMTATTQLSVNWRRTGSKYALYVPGIFAGTSNTTAMTMTGLTGILPFSQGGNTLIAVRDNGANVLGTANVNASNITFGVGAAAGAFTNSGNKGLPSGTLILWDTDLGSVA